VKSSTGYSGTPLARKLGITPGMTVGLIGAPREFRDSLGKLPHGVTLTTGARGHVGLLIWFVRRDAELTAGTGRVARLAGEGHLWIAWRKKAVRPSSSSGPTEQAVRKSGLTAGLVDYKVCAIDETWSGLLFAPRKAAKSIADSPIS
jgi:hypothetical protein